VVSGAGVAGLMSKSDVEAAAVPARPSPFPSLFSFPFRCERRRGLRRAAVAVNACAAGAKRVSRAAEFVDRSYEAG
jgi:hypothetical protein